MVPPPGYGRSLGTSPPPRVQLWRFTNRGPTFGEGGEGGELEVRALLECLGAPRAFDEGGPALPTAMVHHEVKVTCWSQITCYFGVTYGKSSC